MKRAWLSAMILWEFIRYALASLLDPASRDSEDTGESREDYHKKP